MERITVAAARTLLPSVQANLPAGASLGALVTGLLVGSVDEVRAEKARRTSDERKVRMKAYDELWARGPFAAFRDYKSSESGEAGETTAAALALALHGSVAQSESGEFEHSYDFYQSLLRRVEVKFDVVKFDGKVDFSNVQAGKADHYVFLAVAADGFGLWAVPAGVLESLLKGVEELGHRVPGFKSVFSKVASTRRGLEDAEVQARISIAFSRSTVPAWLKPYGGFDEEAEKAIALLSSPS
jgi:hypothetical protein